MKKFLAIATACLVISMFLVSAYVIYGIVWILGLCTFLFGLFIGLLIAWRYSKDKTKIEFGEKTIIEHDGQGSE